MISRVIDQQKTILIIDYQMAKILSFQKKQAI